MPKVREQYADYARQEAIPSAGVVVDNKQLREFVATATPEQLKSLIDSGDLTAKEIGEAQAENKAENKAKAPVPAPVNKD